MEYRLLGRSGLKVSALSMGTWTFGNNSPDRPTGSVGLKDARRQMDMLLDAGVNLVDTANVYSHGQSEEIVGEALEGRREHVLIATKARFNMFRLPNTAGNSRINLIAECERSLKRLRTDRIDLYQLHQWDGQTPLEETMEALDTLIRQGKVRYVGCSNFSAWHIMKALAVAGAGGYQRFVSQQIHYTLQARESEYELVPVSLAEGLGILVWSPIAGGLLSGKFRRKGTGPKGSRHFDRGFKEPPIHDEEKLYDIIEELVAIGEAHGCSAARVALAWLLQRPGISSLIIGGRTEEQFADNLAALDLKLTADDIRRLDSVSEPPLLYPYWHQALTAGDRLSPADIPAMSDYWKRT